VFRGWVPRSETVHYDSDGRVTGRSVQWVESGWDEQSRAEMLALTKLEAEQCPLCGGPAAECQDRDAYEAYEALPVRCHKTTAVAMAQEQRKNTAQPEAVLYQVKRRADG
jgi:hypothetical protein